MGHVLNEGGGRALAGKCYGPVRGHLNTNEGEESPAEECRGEGDITEQKSSPWLSFK